MGLVRVLDLGMSHLTLSNFPRKLQVQACSEGVASTHRYHLLGLVLMYLALMISLRKGYACC